MKPHVRNLVGAMCFLILFFEFHILCVQFVKLLSLDFLVIVESILIFGVLLLLVSTFW